MSDVVHLRCGDDLRESLPLAGFAGDYLTYVDPVCQGPVPDEPDEKGFLDVRARFVAEAYGFPPDEVRQRLADEHAALDRLAGYERVVLWFEHDWFDQAILVRLLATLADRPETARRLRLMSTDAFPGVHPFIGFGQLSSTELATLVGRDEPVTAAQFALAGRAWTALRAATPQALQRLVDDPDPALPYLAAAVGRHLRELPWLGDGLGLTERLCLRALADGRHALHEVFPAVQAADPHPYLGDLQLLPVLAGLAAGERPALRGSAEAGWTLTDHGGALLAGDAVWRGGRRWLGGVLLDGARPSWYWNPDTGRAVAA